MAVAVAVAVAVLVAVVVEVVLVEVEVVVIEPLKQQGSGEFPDPLVGVEVKSLAEF